jgi:site-specific recombinase XerC|nr:MAG TPA: SITE SPECIFIC RECOMBINASE XERD [Caudoviricetes sp.]
MEDVNKKIFIEYVSHLYSTDKSYEVIGKSIKAVKLFLESDYQVNRKGYKAYIRENAVELSDKPYIKDALCGFLNYLGIGYSRTRKEKSVKPLEKLSIISEKNMKLLNEFVYYLTQEEDYSPHTLSIYSVSMKKYFEYANDVSVDNYKRFVKMMENEGFSPQTIRLRITALERFSKWMKKPIELKRPKFKKNLDTENVPTESDYNKLLEYLKTKKNGDLYFYIKILATTGARVSEFIQFKWEDIINGEVTLKGKGNKYRRFFFGKQLQSEVKEYVKKNDKSGYVAVGKFGRLNQRALAMNMKKWGDDCGIEKEKMHPHAFRHFFAKMFLKKNKDVVQLAELMGHGSIDTTRIYLQKSYEEQKREYNRSVTW